MKVSTPSAPRPRTPPSFLFRGPPGGGKSTLAMQFPGVWFADCDLNLKGPEDLLRSVNNDLTFSYDTIALDDDGAPLLDKNGQPDHSKIWLRFKQKIVDAIREPSVKTMCLDGLTHLSTMLTQKVLKDNNAEIMERQYWIPFRNALMEVVMKCRHSGKTLIMTCHEEIILDKLGLINKYNIAMSSKLKDVFGGLFTDVYLCTSKVGARKERRFTITTNGDALRSDLKTSFPTMPITIDVTDDGFAALNKYMNL
jgi:hypothetical protein